MTTKGNDTNYPFVTMPNDIGQHSFQKNNPGLSFLLKELADDDNFFLVCKALFHDDLEVSIGASLALGHMKDLRATPYLLRAVLTTDHKRAEAVMWALGEIGDEASVPFLLSALKANFVPKSAVLALGKIGSKDAFDVLSRTLTDQDEALRVLAAKALGQIRFGSDISLINKASTTLKARLASESSRRVKLMLSVIKSRIEKTFEQ